MAWFELNAGYPYFSRDADARSNLPGTPLGDNFRSLGDKATQENSTIIRTSTPPDEKNAQRTKDSRSTLQRDPSFILDTPSTAGKA
jgi:hypothetical protein